MNTNEHKIIWEDSNAIAKHRKAYAQLIEELKKRLTELEPYSGKLSQELFIDILTGCKLLKEKVIANTNQRRNAATDPDVKDLISDRLKIKLQHITNISAEIEKAKTVKFGTFDVVVIEVALLNFSEKAITWNEEPILEKLTITAGTGARLEVYQAALKLQANIEAFDELVQKATNKTFHGLHSDRWSDTCVLELNDLYEAKINPFIIDRIKS
jgi:hypothetical protein